MPDEKIKSYCPIKWYISFNVICLYGLYLFQNTYATSFKERVLYSSMYAPIFVIDLIIGVFKKTDFVNAVNESIRNNKEKYPNQNEIEWTQWGQKNFSFIGMLLSEENFGSTLVYEAKMEMFYYLVITAILPFLWLFASIY